MIFVTVGTHEQPFNRLIQKVDELKRDALSKMMGLSKRALVHMSRNTASGAS